MSHASHSGSAGAAHAAPAGSPVSGSEPSNTRVPGGPLQIGPPDLGRKRRFSGETVFRFFSTGAGVAVLVIIGAIALFLIVNAIPAISRDPQNFLTYNRWFTDVANPNFGYGIAATAFGTLYTSVIALIVAVPVALGIALCLSHYTPRRIATGLGFIVDLLAAVPSIVFGLWGRDYFQAPVRDFEAWLHHYFGWIPIFGSEGPYGQSILLGGLVLAIMILPIITSLSREVFLQTPAMNQEAAIALGATKWEMIRTSVIPYGRAGIVAACILGLGRALGETIALALTLGGNFVISFDPIQNGGNSIAANIANTFGESDANGRGALIASGLILFAITLVVNVVARAIVARRREFLGSAA
jgi:phosphate transport system permease protein